VSAAVVGEREKRGKVIREIIRPLCAWDSVESASVILPPRTRIDGCRILSNGVSGATSEREPYEMEFEVSGRRYTCPLFRFQPRTESVACVSAEALAI